MNCRYASFVIAAGIMTFSETDLATFSSSEISILVTGMIMLLVLLFFLNGLVGTLVKKSRLPRVLDWD